ncbi:MAG: GNAT family N-acetyltransferase [Alphaproteobacteria bacterium]|nr:GNAT family N-acetyltransferase [Alphaproteobacteria bacterium]
MSQSRGESVSVLILPAGPADAEELARVHVRAWRETYRGLLPDAYLARMSEAAFTRRFRRALTQPGPNDVTLVAASRDGLVGYAEGGPSRAGVPDEAEIATLYLLRQAQGLRLGRRLLTAAARALAAQGAKSLAISVLRDNIRARGFYERLGGAAEPATMERGPGGALLHEVVYRWPEIGRLLEP